MDGCVDRIVRTRPALCLLVLSAWGVWTHGDTDVSCVVMETCMLPCSFQKGAGAAVHWIYKAGDLNVHSYYNNQDQLTIQDQRFTGRTSLFQDQIPRGNASLQLTGVKVQDQGRYLCYTSTVGGNKELYVALNVAAPVTKVHIEQVGDRLICSSEGIYPEPGLSWSTNPPSSTTFSNTTTVQQTEQLLYSISSSLTLPHDAAGVDYSCTVSGSNSRTATLRTLASISSSSTETFVPCTDSHASLANVSLVWRFNGQIILNRTQVHVTVSEQWRQHVKRVSASGITLQQLSKTQEGQYSCELSGDEETYVTNTFLEVLRGPQNIVSASIAGMSVLVLISVAGCLGYYKHKMTQQQLRDQDVQVCEGRHTPAPSDLQLL